MAININEVISRLPKERQQEIADRVSELLQDQYPNLKDAIPSKDIVAERMTIEKVIKELYEKQKHLQDVKCSHINLTYEADGSWGNYDRDDRYWYVWDCKDCGKHWTTDQGKKYTDQYPHAIRVKK
jgi:hypothetical protein